MNAASMYLGSYRTEAQWRVALNIPEWWPVSHGSPAYSGLGCQFPQGTIWVVR